MTTAEGGGTLIAALKRCATQIIFWDCATLVELYFAL
jgi:hypothetical protein